MIQVLKNQAVVFPEVDHNTENEACTMQNLQFCQLVTNGIETQFQVRLTEEDGVDKVTNGNFLTDLSGWVDFGWSIAWASGKARLGAALGNDSLLGQALTLKANTIYKFNYQIPLMFPQFASGQGGLEWEATITDSTTIGGITLGTNLSNQEGYYSFYFLTGITGSHTLTLFTRGLPGLSGTGFIYWDNIEVFELTTPASISLLDCNDNFAASITNISFFEDLATVVVDWQSLNLPDDCYKLCITDGEDLAFDFLTYADMWIWPGGAPIIIDTTNPDQFIAINWI